MTAFSNIVGQKRLIEYFLCSLKNGNISHAYILSGEDDMSKMALAKDFAMALLCSSHDACGVCRSCKQFITDNNPDVIYVTHESTNSIGVDEIRKQIVNDTEIRPYNGGYKVYIVEDAELMTTAAQNAILKTIEEPPEYVVIILLADNAGNFLQTILSRCIVLRTGPVSNYNIVQYLTDNLGVQIYKSKICASLAQGNLGKAVNLIKSERFMDMHVKTVEILKTIYDKPVAQLQAEMAELKNDIKDVLDTMRLWYRDVTVFKATQDINLLIFKEEQQSVKRMADRCSFNGLEEIQNAIEKAEKRLNANVSYDLVTELLIMSLREN